MWAMGSLLSSVVVTDWRVVVWPQQCTHGASKCRVRVLPSSPQDAVQKHFEGVAWIVVEAELKALGVRCEATLHC